MQHLAAEKEEEKLAEKEEKPFAVAEEEEKPFVAVGVAAIKATTLPT